MGQQSGNKLISQGRELPGIAGVKEGVFSALEQGHVHVHPAARSALDGLWHEGGVKPVLLRQGLYRQFEGHDGVGRLESGRIFDVNFVLAGSRLVVAGLDLKAHGLQIQTDLPAGALPVVQGAQVEVSRLVRGPGGGPAVLVGVEQEKLQLRPHMKGQPHRLRPGQGALEDAPGIAGKGRPIRVVDVADEPGHLAILGPPGQHREGVQIRPQVLVRLLHPDKSLNGTAVHQNLVVQRPLDLGGGNRYIL